MERGISSLYRTYGSSAGTVLQALMNVVASKTVKPSCAVRYNVIVVLPSLPASHQRKPLTPGNFRVPIRTEREPRQYDLE